MKSQAKFHSLSLLGCLPLLLPSSDEKPDPFAVPLHQACSSGQLKLVKEFLNAGAKPNWKDEKMGSPLIAAVGGGNVEIVDLLLEKGATFDPKHPIDKKLLAAAIGLVPDAMLLRECDEKFPKDVQASPECERYRALRDASRKLTKRFLDAGFDPNIPAGYCESTLMLAATKGDEVLVTQLLDHGAQLQHKDRQGSNALSYALSMNQAAVSQVLLRRGAEVIHEKDSEGNNHLLLALQMGNPEVLRLLLEKGAKIDIKNNRSDTPLMIAAMHEDPLLAKYLIDRGANVNDQHGFLPLDRRGYTPLLFAISFERFEMAKFLIEKGADVNARETVTGYTPLLGAAARGNLPLVELLLSKGADRSQKNDDGDTALQLAIKNKHLEVAERLRK